MFGLKKDLGYFHSVKWGAAAIGVSLLRQILLVPVFIMALGGKGYSTWLLLFSLVSFVNALASGFLHYSCNLINISYHAGKNIQSLVYSVVRSTVWIVLIQLVLGFGLSSLPLLSLFVNLDLAYLNASNASSAFLFLLGGRLFYQYNTGFVLRLFEPSGNIKETLKFQFFSDFSDVIATAVLVYFTRNLLYTCAGLFVVNAITFCFSVVYVNRKTHFFSFKGVSTVEGGLIKKSLGLNAGFFIEKMYDSWLNILVSHFFGPVLVPVFNTTQKLVNIFYRLSYMIVQPLFPAIQKYFAVNDYALVSALIRKHWRISIVIIIASVTAAIPIIPALYRFWTGNVLEFDEALLSYLFMGILFQNFVFVISEFLKKTNFSRQFMVYSIIRAGTTILFMWIFSCYKYMPGIGESIAIAELVCMFYMLWVFSRKAIFLPQTFWYLGHVLIYCGLLLIYVFIRNYLVLLVPVVLQIVLILFFNRNSKGI